MTLYVPPHFRVDDADELYRFIEQHAFATLVSTGAAGLHVSHIPLLAERGDDGKLRLLGHVARGNAQWEALEAAAQVLAIFHGPHAYVSPGWYQAHPSVPTWNYAVVHAHGVPRVMDDAAWLLKHVTAMTHTQESRHQSVEWKVSDAPADFIDSMLKMIVGIEIPMATLVGKWKMSQNRAMPDRLGTIAGLKERGDSNSEEVAAIVEGYAKR